MGGDCLGHLYKKWYIHFIAFGFGQNRINMCMLYIKTTNIRRLREALNKQAYMLKN